MAAFNSILANVLCPICGNRSEMRCRTYAAVDYAGDASGRFAHREYRIGDVMAWWPRTHPRFSRWIPYATEGTIDTGDVVEEACTTTCPNGDAQLFAIVRFQDRKPVEIRHVGREDDWPRWVCALAATET